MLSCYNCATMWYNKTRHLPPFYSTSPFLPHSSFLFFPIRPSVRPCVRASVRPCVRPSTSFILHPSTILSTHPSFPFLTRLLAPSSTPQYTIYPGCYKLERRQTRHPNTYTLHCILACSVVPHIVTEDIIPANQHT